MAWIAVVFVLALVVVIFREADALRVVDDDHVLVVRRLGVFHRVAQPGAHVVLPGIEATTLVALGPRRITAAVAASTADGLEVRLEATAVERIVDPVLAIRSGESYRMQVSDVMSAVLAEYAATTTASDLQLKPGGVQLQWTYEANLRLAAIGSQIDRFTIVQIEFPPPYLDSATSLALAGARQQIALLEAQTRQLVAGVDTTSTALRLERLAELSQRLDAELERLRTIEAVGRTGSIVMTA